MGDFFTFDLARNNQFRIFIIEGYPQNSRVAQYWLAYKYTNLIGLDDFEI